MVNINVNKTLDAEQVLYSNPIAVRQLAVTIMANMAESNIDMVCDEQDSYPTKEDIEVVFSGLHEQSQDFVNDAIDELKAALMQYLRNVKYTTKVRQLTYDTDGRLGNIGLDLTVE